MPNVVVIYAGHGAILAQTGSRAMSAVGRPVLAMRRPQATLPAEFRCVDEFPHTAAGKVRKPELSAQLATRAVS